MFKPCLLFKGVNKAERPDRIILPLWFQKSIQNNQLMKKTQVWRIASCRKAKI